MKYQTTTITTPNNREIIMVSVDRLKPYPNNARMHSAKQVQQIANSINEFGFTNPVLVSADNTIMAGLKILMVGIKYKINSTECHKTL